MLPKINRLTKRGSFTYVYNKGKRNWAGLISLVYVRSKTLRIGFCVPNKVGKAVVRNKVKRRLRAVCRLLSSSLEPVQAVISAKVGAGELSYKEIEGLVYKLFSNAALLKTEPEKKAD